MPLAQLLRREGLSAEAKEVETLSMSKLFALEIKGVALICLCFLEHATPAQLHYATRRLRRKASMAARRLNSRLICGGTLA
jgi:hypothetical protein